MKNKNLNWSKSKSGQGKRNITKIFTVGMVAAFFLYNTKMAQAAEMIKASQGKVEIYSNFDYSKAGRYTKRFIDKEVNNDTGLLSSEFEKVLNYSGITDEDLKQYSKADLYELKNSEIISVSVKAYYKDEYNNINTMTDTEIEEYYEEEFADDIGNTDGILQWFGILPYEVKAASDSDTTDGKMFTHKIVLTQASRASSGTVKVHLIYTGQWLEVPYYNSDDYIDLQLQNATFLKGYTYKYTYEYLESSLKYDINGNPVSGSETEPVRKSKTITIPTYVKLAFKEAVVFQELAGGINGKIKSEFITDDCFSTCYIRQVQSHKFYFSIYAVLDNPNIKRIDASAYYYHLYKSSQIVPSLSVSAGTGGASISLGISASDKRKYKALGSVGEGNVLMTYIHYK